MATTLERSYRSLLRLFPRDWRQLHGEALIGTLLDAAEARQAIRPSAGERVDLILAAAEARMSSAMSAAQRSLLCAVSAGVGLALVVCSAAYDLARPAWLVHAGVGLSWNAAIAVVGAGAFALGWLLPLAAALLGYRRAAIAAWGAFELLVFVDVMGAVLHQQWVFADPTSALFAGVLSLGALAARPRWPLLAAVSISVAAAYALLLSYVETTAVDPPDAAAVRLFRSLHFYLWAGALNFGNLAVVLAAAALAAICLRIVGHRKTSALVIAIAVPWAVAWAATGAGTHEFLAHAQVVMIMVGAGVAASVVVRGVVVHRHAEAGRTRRV